MSTNPTPAARVRELAETFMKEPRFVTINSAGLDRIAKEIENTESLGTWEEPSMPIEDLVLYELIAGSVNYAYWLGRSDVRPNGATSVMMYDLLKAVFTPNRLTDDMLRDFAMRMTEAGFPLSEQRTAHLLELLAPLDGTSLTADLVPWIAEQTDPHAVIARIARCFPGYGRDPFLKRAFLFAIQLHRSSGGTWCWEKIGQLPVPADYQVPKILRALDVIEYFPELAAKVGNHEMLPENSLAECEIRAATIVACDELAERASLRPCDIDTFLWLRRKTATAPFHLCATTNY